MQRTLLSAPALTMDHLLISADCRKPPQLQHSIATSGRYFNPSRRSAPHHTRCVKALLRFCSPPAEQQKLGAGRSEDRAPQPRSAPTSGSSAHQENPVRGRGCSASYWEPARPSSAQVGEMRGQGEGMSPSWGIRCWPAAGPAFCRECSWCLQPQNNSLIIIIHQNHFQQALLP